MVNVEAESLVPVMLWVQQVVTHSVPMVFQFCFPCKNSAILMPAGKA